MTSYQETSRKVISAIRRHAATPGAERVRWWLDRSDGATSDDVWGSTDGPSLSIGVGPGVGLVVWLDAHDSYITTGGINTGPVRYEIDEWVDAYYPPGSEHPIGIVIEVLEQFIEHGRRPDTVNWGPYDPSQQELIFKGQAENPNR